MKLGGNRPPGDNPLLFKKQPSHARKRKSGASFRIDNAKFKKIAQTKLQQKGEESTVKEPGETVTGDARSWYFAGILEDLKKARSYAALSNRCRQSESENCYNIEGHEATVIGYKKNYGLDSTE